jgi:hypothetical protein
MATTEDRLQVERELGEVTARLHSGAAITYDERQLLVTRQQELIARKLELNPPPTEPTEADGVAAFERGEAWRKASSEFHEKRRELQRVLTSSGSSASELEAAEKALRELPAPTYSAECSPG